MASRVYNFHLRLSPELHDMLRAESEVSGETATDLVREALADWLRRRRKQRRYAEIAAFSAKNSRTELDLDRNLEEAGIEVIEAVAETELKAHFKDLIEQLAARAPAEAITDADIDREVQAVRNAARPA